MLIKVHGLTYEALSVAKGNRQDLPPALIKLWKTAQKMRTFFDFGDVKSSVPKTAVYEGIGGSSSINTTKLQRTYSGSPADIVRQTADEILVRIRYLLASKISDKVDEQRSAKQNWKILAKITRDQMEQAKAKSNSEDRFANAAFEVEQLISTDILHLVIFLLSIFYALFSLPFS